ncbi:hypothetical protein B296_00049411 [Ensete ventricosum]|uniref:Uncharacterized protein n=1 Tax=Ensete ventricosum TaxID=4639 RepID=A0A426YQQ3_ENSVE|nr:hypothetical protein B296_00049411 [Ensete ventricosum]
MFKFLKGVVGGSGTGPKDLPYNIGEPYPSAWGSWTHHRGTSKEDGSSVSIFSLSGSSSQDGHLAAGRNGVKRLRTVTYSTFTCRFQSPTHFALDRMMPLQCLPLLFSTRRG